ncbi:hypothetical protein AB0A77_00250 [Streptomyces varsoviensis]
MTSTVVSGPRATGRGRAAWKGDRADHLLDVVASAILTSGPGKGDAGEA